MRNETQSNDFRVLAIIAFGVQASWNQGVSASKMTHAVVAAQMKAGKEIYLMDNGTELTESQMMQRVKTEGKIVSYGMPDNWANLGTIWKGFTEKYGVKHEDTDMGSQEELSKFKAEKNAPVADVGDVGIAFGPMAVSMGVVAPFKNSHWSEIPDWAKDPNGYWCAEYLGTVAFAVRTDLVKNVPTSFADLLKPEYKNKVSMDDPRQGAQGQFGLLAATYANGGTEKDLTPGYTYFAKLKASGNLLPVETNAANFQKGEIGVAIIWDFRAINFKESLNVPMKIVIPSDGTAVGPYVAVINAYAPHPNAARALNNYLFSDEAQAAYAAGGARPIRNVKLPAEVLAKFPPMDSYKSAKAITDWTAWQESSKNISDNWASLVLSK